MVGCCRHVACCVPSTFVTHILSRVVLIGLICKKSFNVKRKAYCSKIMLFWNNLCVMSLRQYKPMCYKWRRRKRCIRFVLMANCCGDLKFCWCHHFTKRDGNNNGRHPFGIIQIPFLVSHSTHLLNIEYLSLFFKHFITLINLIHWKKKWVVLT